MNPLCHICSAPAVFLFDKDGYPHFKCPKCGLVFVHPQPLPSFLAEEVYSEKSGYQSNKKGSLDGVIPSRKQAKLVGHLRARPGHEGQAFLDVGCSSGEIMHFARSQGYAVKGVELNPRTAAVARANGIDVHIGTLESARYPDASFDVVHMGDVIEHVPDPRSFVREAHRILKPGGEIVVLTPNMDCFWARSTFSLWKLFRIPWSMSTPPHHLYQFSAGNLRLLLGECGFGITSEWYCPVATLKYELGSLHLYKRWKNSHSLADLAFMVFAFALYGLLFVLNRIAELLPGRRFAMAMAGTKS